MLNQTLVPIGPFKALFEALIHGSFIDDVLQRCGVLRRRPPTLAAVELIQSLVFHVVAEAGTLAQQRALLPIAVFDEIMHSALQPKADPQLHPEAFYHGLRLCAIDGSTFSVTNTPQVKKQLRKPKSRRGKAAFPKVGVAVLLKVGLHNPLAAALGAEGESEMVLAQRVLADQPAYSLMLSDRYYGVGKVLVGLPAAEERHFLVRVKINLKRHLLEVYADGSALVEIRAGQDTRLVREIVGRVQRGKGGPVTTVRLCTSLLDWRAHPAVELLGLNARRWEQEVFYKERKVDARSTPYLQSHTRLLQHFQEFFKNSLIYAIFEGWKFSSFEVCCQIPWKTPILRLHPWATADSRNGV